MSLTCSFEHYFPLKLDIPAVRTKAERHCSAERFVGRPSGEGFVIDNVFQTFRGCALTNKRNCSVNEDVVAECEEKDLRQA